MAAYSEGLFAAISGERSLIHLGTHPVAAATASPSELPENTRFRNRIIVQYYI